MTKSIVAGLLCIPFAANAHELFVQYEGTISSIDRALLAGAPAPLGGATPYAVGDPIKEP
jgi:hypothetical protein